MTYQLITKLFEKSESRGEDAAGYWGVESGLNGKVLYHKEPGKSSLFVKKDMWEQIVQHNPSLLIVHARGASKGVGGPSVNNNNHPFTSLDKSIGLVHNGRVDDNEYRALKEKYDVTSQCDSEILLRVFEGGECYSPKELKDSLGEIDMPHRMAGCRDIFSFINHGHMAVAVGERGLDGERMLWLFRNQHRPLWIVDMRDSLGQVFFVSEPSIWDNAVNECSGAKNLCKTQKLIELPTEEIWFFKTTSTSPCPEKVERFEVCREGRSFWKFDGKKVSIFKKNRSFEVITKLDENDNVVSTNHKQKSEIVELVEWDEFPVDDLNQKCKELVDLIVDIRSNAEYSAKNQSITRQDFEQLLVKLDEQIFDLEHIHSKLIDIN